MSYRRHVIIIILLSFLPLVVIGGGNYAIDPLQVYRKQQWMQPFFWVNQRSQNAGKIKNYLKNDRFDSIILGNSVADNFIPSHVEQILGWGKTMKLTLDGGYPSEVAFMLEKALLYGKIKHVLWVIRPDNFTPNLKERWHPIQKMPFYLYSKCLLDDWPYIFSVDMFNKSISLISGSANLKNWQIDLDTLNYWQSEQHILKQIYYNKTKNLKILSDQIKEKNIEDIRCISSKSYPLSEMIFDFVKKNPGINFYFLIAPKTYQSLKIRPSRKLTDYYCFQRFFVFEASNYENMNIFGFENTDNISGNLANYRDANHYHSGVNDFMLHKIALGHNRLNVDNIDEYIQSIIRKLNRYDMYSSFSTMIPFAKDDENVIFQKVFSEQILVNFLQEARSKLRERDYDGAIGFTDKVLQKPLSDSNLRAKAYSLRATVYHRLGNLDAALEDYNSAIDLHLKNASVYVDRGVLRQKQKDLKGAEADFLTAISLAPDYYRGYWFLGNLRSEKGLYEEGIALLTKAIELNPKRSALYSDRGKIFQAFNRKDLALKDFQKVKELKNS